MKLLLTIDFPPEKGGIQNYLFNLVKHTYGFGDLVLAGSAFPVDERPNDILCKIRYFSTPLSRYNKKLSLLPVLVALYKTVRNRKNYGTIENPLIEAGNVYSAIPAFLLSYILPLRYSVYCYGKELLPLQKKGLRSLFLKMVLKKACAFQVISSHSARLLKKGGIQGNLIHLPPRIELPSGEIPVKEKIRGEYVNLLCVGRLVRHKGHAVLIEAAKQLPSGYPWKLTIAGSGPERKSLETLIGTCKLESRITLKTELSDAELSEEYLNSDIFVFPSIDTDCGTEGFGIVLLEAMAHGVPIIASRTGAIPEVLDDGACGMLVTPGNPAEIASAVIRLLSDDNLRLGFIKRAAQHLRNHYVW